MQVPRTALSALGWLLAGCLALSSGGAAAARVTFKGKVVGVVDGDTITVLRDKTPVKIRLHGVAAPLLAQPFGEQARQLSSRLVLGKVVEVEIVAKDVRGRLEARVHVTTNEGTDHYTDGSHADVDITRCLNEELVKAGLAWWDRNAAPQDKRLAQLEAAARAARRGLWADKAPVAPWDWQRGKRTQQPLGVLMGTQIGEAHGTATVDVTHPVSGNVKSRVYHWFTCPDLRTCKRCSAAFKTPAQAARAGFRPHRACMQAASAAATCKADGDCDLRLCCCRWRALVKGAPAPAVCARRCRCKLPPRPRGVRCVGGRCEVIRQGHR